MAEGANGGAGDTGGGGSLSSVVGRRRSSSVVLQLKNFPSEQRGARLDIQSFTNCLSDSAIDNYNRLF